jgi:hypothetical protein
MVVMHLVRRSWSRRDFIRAAGIAAGAAALAPWVPSESQAATSGLKRLILVHTGNGSLLERWRSNGAGAKLVDGAAIPELKGPILSPLDAHRERLVLLDGIDLAAIFEGPTGKHKGPNKGHAGSSVLWTGMTGGGQSFPDDAGEYPTGPSVDQIINGRIGEGRPSLQVSTWTRPIDPRNVWSYDESGTPLPPEANPQIVFDKLFKDGFPSGETTTVNRKSERRKRSLEHLRGELNRLRAEWPAGDRDRFDRHVEALDALEAQIAALQNGPQCNVGPDNRPTIGEDYKSDIRATTDAQIDNIVHGLACDRTRVVSFALSPENTWPSPGSQLGFLPDWSGAEAFKTEAHAISHYTNLEPEASKREQAAKQMEALNAWHAEKLGLLIDKLTKAGVMDDTLIVWGTAMSHGGAHSNRSTPFVIAQGSSGPLVTNRYFRWGNFEQPATDVCNGCSTGDPDLEANNNLLITLCHAFGLDDIEQVGEAAKCRSTGLDERLMK